MLFNSYPFIFVFLPTTIVLSHAAALRSHVKSQVAVLLAASIIFYAWWDMRFLPLLGSSIAVNYAIGRALGTPTPPTCLQTRDRRRGGLLAAGVIFNLILLGVFKYCNFLTNTLNAATGSAIPLLSVILPLGISFFTFEQIAYIVDTWRSGAAERDPMRYALFVAFFPRLVAGPILRASEFLPQLVNMQRRDATVSVDIAIGVTMFAIGLFKKTFIADGVAPYASALFASADSVQHPDMLTAWEGALAYTFQLYFDFSGYSDMAIGAARCVGIRFPLNFWSPYKSTSVIAFWGRWHMTLSRFLRDYLYIPLGGNRRGPGRRFANLIATMLLGGLWHGASWTFVAWGGLHGGYLVINHGWRTIRSRSGWLDRLHGGWPAHVCCWALTFGAVVVGWVFFRAASFQDAVAILRGMAGLNGVIIPSSLVSLLAPIKVPLTALGVTFGAGSGSMLIAGYGWIAALGALSLIGPNTAELLAAWQPTLGQPPGTTYARLAGRRRWQRWRPSTGWAVVTATLGVVGILSIARGSEFLYWQF